MSVATSPRILSKSQFARLAACAAALTATAPAQAVMQATVQSPKQAVGRTFTVGTAAELRTALLGARPGDTVLLAPADYGNFNFDRFRFTDGFVNIRSADPANRARFGQLLMRGTTGLAISGLDIQSSISPVINIGSGSNIRLAGNRIRGGTANADPFDDPQTGLWVRGSQNVVVASNDFQDLRLGALIQRSTSVAIRHNNFIHLREGLNVAAATRGDIANNHFERFSPNYGIGEHPDVIQFWNRNETQGVTHFTIRNNFLSMGNNGAIHGIFLGNEIPTIPHSNLEVSGNVYYGSALHGISLGAVNNARVFNNVVVASPWADNNNASLRTPDGRTGGAMQPRIRLGTGTGVEAFRNVAMGFNQMDSGRTATDNIDLWEANTRTGEPWTNVFEARPTDRLPALAAFTTKSPSLAATRSIGIQAPFKVGVVTLDPAAAQALAASQPLP
jgi:nitrous oxidase accessory protein NosD